METCKNCGGSSLSWETSMAKAVEAPNSRLGLHDVKCEFYLFCEDCSETLQIVPAARVAQALTMSGIRF